MNKKILNISIYLWIFIFVIIVSGIIFFIILQSKKAHSIKIGAILTLSGPAKEEGIEVRNGMLLAANEINSRNGINGRKLELIIRDSKTDPKEGIKQFNEIEKIYSPLFYVSCMSIISMSLAPLSEENNVVLVGLVTGNTKFTENKKWIFRYFTNAGIEAQTILYILERLKVKNLGIIYSNDEYGASIFENVNNRFRANNKVVKDEPFDSKEADYKKYIIKFQEMEAICFIGYNYHIFNGIKQLREINYKGYIITSMGGSTPLVKDMPESDGVYAVSPFIYNSNYLFAKESKEKYEIKYNIAFTHLAANGYDFIKFIADLLGDKEISRENVKTTLERGFIYSGVFGTIKVKPDEHEINFPLFPAKIVNGKLEYLNLYR